MTIATPVIRCLGCSAYRPQDRVTDRDCDLCRVMGPPVESPVMARLAIAAEALDRRARATPRPGDVVRIGDLPAGAVVRDDFGCDLLVGERNGSGDINMRRPPDGSPWPCPGTTTMRLVSLPDTPPVEESAAVAHWHRKAADLEAALARVTAERDEARKIVDGVTTELRRACPNLATRGGHDTPHDVARGFYLITKERDEACADRDQMRAERDVHACRIDDLRSKLDAATTQSGVVRKERDAAVAQVTALQEAVAENGRLRAEKEIDRSAAAAWEKIHGLLVAHTKSLETTLAERDTEIDGLRAECARLRTVATGYATTRRDRDAVATICEALCTPATPYAATPDGALLAIRDLRAELIAHAERTQEAREMLATRDAQEGDRIAAWAEAGCRAACGRCWYPCDAVPMHDRDGTPICDACAAPGLNERASAEEGDDG